MRTWRDIARPIITEVIARIGLDHPKELQKALRDAYPFGERRYWPYKVWLDEIHRQLKHQNIKPQGIISGQLGLFDK